MFKLQKQEKEKDKVMLSLPTAQRVCGYEIKKMPIGPYLKALERLKSMPEDLMAAAFPGMSLQEVLDSLSTLGDKDLTGIVMNLMVVVPEYILGLVAELTGIDEDNLINDENIGLDGIVEIILTFIEVNRLGKFIEGAKEISQTLKNQHLTTTKDTGSNA